MAESTSVRLVGNLITAQFHAAALYVAISSNLTATFNENVPCNVFMQSAVCHIPTTIYNPKIIKNTSFKVSSSSY
jgi:hypothetical protein